MKSNNSEITKDIVLSRPIILLMAAATGIVVANLYYIQPLLGEIAKNFGVTQSSIGILAMLTQIGYASGMFFLLPLGDIKERRSLIIYMLLYASVSLFLMSVSANLIMLSMFSFAIGVTSVVPQLIVPFAANLAPSNKRGKTIGTVMTGLLIGILISRTFSGIIGAEFGWRTVYRIAAVVMILLSVLLKLFLPQASSRSNLSYINLIKSLWHLIKAEPVLREASIGGAMMFGTFSAFWSTLVFLLESPSYGLGAKEAGLFGLIGICGALAASFVGPITDRKSPRFTFGIAVILSTLSYICFLIFGMKLWGLVLGVILLDIGIQSGQISNQARIYALKVEAHNRINTVYMVSYFVGGALGSMLGSYGWGLAGWSGVCAVGLLFQFVAIVSHLSKKK